MAARKVFGQAVEGQAGAVDRQAPSGESLWEEGNGSASRLLDLPFGKSSLNPASGGILTEPWTSLTRNDSGWGPFLFMVLLLRRSYL